MASINVLPDHEKIDVDMGADMKPGNAALAIEHGGVRTKYYQQGNVIHGAAKYYRKMKGRKWEGVCFSMVLHWIAMHANDQDFWGWVDANNGGNALAVMNIIGTQYDYFEKFKNQSKGLPKMSDSQFSRRFLGQPKWGVIPKRSIASGVHQTMIGLNMSKMNSVARGQAVADHTRGCFGGVYYNIGVYRPSGHAVGAWVSHQDALFFDPNHGEFWFEKAKGFTAFIAEFMQYNYSRFTMLDVEAYGKKA